MTVVFGMRQQIWWLALRMSTGSRKSFVKRWSRGLGGRFQIIPLSETQKTVLSILSENRAEESHLSGASAIHLSQQSLRYSGDLDLFHDSEKSVAEAFARDRAKLEKNGFSLSLELSQPGLPLYFRDPNGKR